MALSSGRGRSLFVNTTVIICLLSLRLPSDIYSYLSSDKTSSPVQSCRYCASSLPPLEMGLTTLIGRGNLHIIPTIVCLITPLTFICTFLLSVYNNHVFPFLPYISDTGAEWPESCVFSQFVNIAALLLSCCVYVRGLQVDNFANFKFRIGPRLRLNTLATYIGYCSCLGLSMVANFQVNRLKGVHYLGAGLCFLGGAIYFILQTIFSYHMGKEFESKCVYISRCILCSFCLFFLIVAITTAFTESPSDQMHWTPNEPYYPWHVISTSAEWLLALTQSCLVLTFFPDFKPIKIRRPEVYIDGISLST